MRSASVRRRIGAPLLGGALAGALLGCGPEEVSLGQGDPGSTQSGFRLAHYVKPRDRQPESGFGRSLARAGGAIFVAAHRSHQCSPAEAVQLDCDRRGLIARYPTVPTDPALIPLQPEDTADADQLGHALASDGRWLAGSRVRGLRGEVVVFETEPEARVVQVLESPSSARSFGFALDVDDPWLAAVDEDAVHLYRHGAGGFTLAQTLPLPSRRLQSGSRRVDLDGSTLVVGDPEDERDCADARGLVQVFRLEQDGWRPADPLDAEAPCTGFGTSVAIRGPRLYVGAPLGGEVMVHDLGTLARLDRYSVLEGAIARFGYSVAVDDEALIVGAPYERSCTVRDDPGAPELAGIDTSCNGNQERGPGAVFAFDLTRPGAEPVVFKGVLAQAKASFGHAVALAPDGLVVGAPGDGSLGVGVGELIVPPQPAWTSAVGSGAIYVYERAIR